MRRMRTRAGRGGVGVMALVGDKVAEGVSGRGGFVRRDEAALEEKLKGYSEEALYMVRAG